MKRRLFSTIFATILLIVLNGGFVLGKTQNENSKTTFTVSYQIVNFPAYGTITAHVNGTYFPSGSVVNAGDDVYFIVSPFWGYSVQAWDVNGIILNHQQNEYVYLNVQTNLTVNVLLKEHTYPQISPVAAFFVLYNPQDLVFDIVWGDETTISYITRQEWYYSNFDTLTLGTHYNVVGNQLILFNSYIQSLNPIIYDTYDFIVEFGSGTKTMFFVTVVGTDVPAFNPTHLTYDLDNPGNLYTMILYTDALKLLTLTHNNVPLVAGVDYEIQRTILIIKQSFLSQHLHTVGQSLSLVGTFYNAATANIQITATQSGFVNATISPESAIFNETQLPPYVDITITWNGASSVTGLLVRFASEHGVHEFPWYHYQVTNLGGGTANLRVFFDDKAKLELMTKEYTYYKDYQVLIFFNQGAPASFLLTVYQTVYNVNVTIEPEDAGFVTGAWEYTEGEEVFLFADPFWGYVFSHWTDENGSILGTSSVLTFTMPAFDVNITAYFVPGHMIEYWSNDFGTVEAYSNGMLIESGASVPEGSRVVFKAYPNPGYFVETWLQNDTDLSFNGLEYVVQSIDQYIYMYVVFAPIPIGYYMVSYNVVGGNGELSAAYNNAHLFSGGLVYNNSSVTFTATPNFGYRVKEWTINGEVIPDYFENQLTVPNIAGTLHVTVEFVQIVSIEPKPTLSFGLHPNPIESMATIATSVDLVRIKVVNVIGQEVLTIEKPSNQINLIELSSGIYFVVGETVNGDIVTQKIIKK